MRLVMVWHSKSDRNESFVKVRRIAGFALDLLKSESLEVGPASLSTPVPGPGFEPKDLMC